MIQDITQQLLQRQKTWVCSLAPFGVLRLFARNAPATGIPWLLAVISPAAAVLPAAPAPPIPELFGL